MVISSRSATEGRRQSSARLYQCDRPDRACTILTVRVPDPMCQAGKDRALRDRPASSVAASSQATCPGPASVSPQAPARPGPVPRADADGIPGPATLGTGKVNSPLSRVGEKSRQGSQGAAGDRVAQKRTIFLRLPWGPLSTKGIVPIVT